MKSATTISFHAVTQHLKQNFLSWSRNQSARDFQRKLFVMDIDPKTLWEIYLQAIPASEDPQSFNCNTCKQFFKNWAAVTYLDDDLSLKSIWSFTVGDPIYQSVLDRLAQAVLQSSIKKPFLLRGQHQLNADRTLMGTHTWYHFSMQGALASFSYRSQADYVDQFHTHQATLIRAFEELSPTAIDTAIELIELNQVYRGQSSLPLIQTFQTLQKQYLSLEPALQSRLVAQIATRVNYQSLVHIRNSAIGTLLQDLSEEVEIETALNRFENVMAPQNYQRPKGVFTSSQIDKARSTLEKLGLLPSLERRLASLEDIHASNVLFINRRSAAASPTSILDLLEPTNSGAIKASQFDKCHMVTFETFLKAASRARQVELLLTPEHQSHLVSLIAPVNLDAPSITQWDNGFSWSYTNGLADSAIRSRAQARGADIKGELGITLAWYNKSDLDLWVQEPDGFKIYYGQPSRASSGYAGQLNLDENRLEGTAVMDPVENILYKDPSRTQTGWRTVTVHNYSDRSGQGGTPNLTVEIKCRDALYQFQIPKINYRSQLIIAKFHYERNKGITQIESNYSYQQITNSQTFWGLKPNQFHPVNAILHSPNYWEGEAMQGNKHTFFMLEGCTNTEDNVRGFMNEMLPHHLKPHRQVFEALGAKSMVNSDVPNQLSGVGFSTGSDSMLVFRITANERRVVRVLMS